MGDLRRLAAAGLVLAGCAGMARLPDPVARLPEMAAWTGVATIGWGWAWWRSRASGRAAIAVVLVVAAAARALLLVPSTPLSDDLYRYLWDGRVANAGIDPFRYAPAAAELASLRDDEIWTRINHPSIPTIYPPVAQLYFRALDAVGAGARGPRAGAAVLDVATTALLAALLRRRGRPVWLAAVHGWCPLAILESAGGGHVDAVGATLLLAGLLALPGVAPARAVAGGALLAASALVKPVAVLLGPVFLAGRSPGRRWLLAGAAAVMLLVIPHLDAGFRVTTGLRTYAEHWQFNDALYTPLVRTGLPGGPTRIGLAILLGAVSVAAARRIRDPLAASAVVIGAFLVCSPTVYPWYALWLVPLLPFLPCALRPPGAALVALLPISYVTPWAAHRAGVWREPDWPRVLLWSVVGALLLAGAARSLAGRSHRESGSRAPTPADSGGA